MFLASSLHMVYSDKKQEEKVSLSLDIFFFVTISRRKVLLFGFTRVFLTKSRRKIFAVVVTLTHGVFLHWFIRENLWFFIVMVVLDPPAAYHNSWLWVLLFFLYLFIFEIAHLFFYQVKSNLLDLLYSSLCNAKFLFFFLDTYFD